ncbi:hypothetical protein DL96DRAFT_1584602 [Flagelloscypha sp. PMI_526]|nr:hypothetical protein DL96DRAFT_1584602 [Flagelloscypha sp. PMI_526]
MSTAPQGLLFVLGEPGPDVSTDQFEDWFDNEHGLARIKLPGVHTTARYQALDGEPPSYLALYELDDLSVVTGAGWTSLYAKASDNEKQVISRAGTLHRRGYTLLTDTGPSPSTSTNVAPWIVIVEAEFKDTEEALKEIDEFYAQEHIPMHTKVPGFIRARRWKLDSWKELANGDKETAPRKFITMYEMSIDSKVYIASKEHQELIHTPWMKDSTERCVVSKKARQYKLGKQLVE